MRSYRAVSITMLLATVLSGCAPVRENRQINFSADGTNVGFQHGIDGVFVAGGNGEGLRKIFAPPKDALAVSSPLFSPTDKRLIFTTARPVSGTEGATKAWNPFDPAGAIHEKCPVVYTCWLRGDNDGDKPEKLFDALCDHPGYVAANLAVRWHPKGDRLLFLDHGDYGLHGIFEFDLASKTKKQAFPHQSFAVIFDWAPDNEHLVCIIGDEAKTDERTGIWIGKPGADDWWHVPGSKALAIGELPSTIEQLRATRPAWSTGGRFAFASSEVSKGKEQPKHLLSDANLATRTVTRLAVSDQPFRDLHWAKDGRLGVVEGTTLRIVEGGKLRPTGKVTGIRQFAGWSSDGTHLAYVAYEPSPLDIKKWMALMFVPDPLARDAIFLAPGSADSPGREALSGVRVTFPHWSPTDKKLSFWGTFTPSHRSWLGTLLRSGLLPGDPAAVIDLSTSQVTWMPISPGEMVQVGHVHLLKRDYAEAWRWYEQARVGEAGAQLSPEEDFSFFESYCLSKLGRRTEAKAKLEQFRKSFAISFNALRIPPGFQIAGRSSDEWVKEINSPESLSGQFLRDLYQGEVLLSLGVAEDAEAHFKAEMASARSEEERLSRAVLLAQMHLVQGKRRDYGQLLTSTLLPLAVKRYDGAMLAGLLRNTNLQALDGASVQQVVLVATAGVTLLPLMDQDVLDGIREKDLKRCLPLLEELADKSMNSMTRWSSHVILFAVARRLGRDRERQKAFAVLRTLDDQMTVETFDERARADLAATRGMLQGLVALMGGRR